MKPQLAPRDRRALMLGGLLVLPALAWSLVGAPYLQALQETQARLEVEAELLERELSMLAQMDGYPVVFQESLARLTEMEPRLLGGSSVGATSAALTSYLQDRARRNEVLISRVQPVVKEPLGALHTVALEVGGESDLQGVLAFLHALETDALLVHVEQLQIGRSNRRAGPVAHADETGPERLSFEFIVTGFKLASTEPADSLQSGGQP